MNTFTHTFLLMLLMLNIDLLIATFILAAKTIISFDSGTIVAVVIFGANICLLMARFAADRLKRKRDESEKENRSCIEK